MRHPMQNAGLLLLAVFVGLALVSEEACAPVDVCDSGQYYHDGACRLCPSDAQATKRSCVCDDHAKEFVDGKCRYPNGEAPDAGSAAMSPTGDASADASSSGAHVDGACSDYCGFLKSCIADNMSVSGLVGDVLNQVGVAGGDPTKCEATCSADASKAENSAALACFKMQSSTATCAGNQTLDGAGQALDIMDSCCSQHGKSDVCVRLCKAIKSNAIASSYVPACQ